MPMPRHGRRDSNESEIVYALQQVGATVWRLDTPVDLLVGFRGTTYLLDPKTKTGRPTKLQRDFIEAWRGGPVGFVRTITDALVFIGAMEPDWRGAD